MITVKQVLERIMKLAESKGYKTTTYANHLVIYSDEFKVDITVIDDNVIVIQTRDFPRDRINVVKVSDIMNKSDEELYSLLNL